MRPSTDNLAPWFGDVPWLRCDACGKGRAELAKNLAEAKLCNLTCGCPGTLRRDGSLPALIRSWKR